MPEFGSSMPPNGEANTQGEHEKKLQVFVSSTYRDLLVERQAAVEAILRAGHIPAGMELFAAGDKSQLETIYRWIDESDVYMLILGARYGSLDSESGKSYTQIEYEYAISTGIRFFAVVLTDKAIDDKIRAAGRAVMETDHQKELSDFKNVVTSKICRMVDDSKDIKLAVHETILEFLREYTFDGWVSGKNIGSIDNLSREVAQLAQENANLKEQLRSALAKIASSSANKSRSGSEDEFDEILILLVRESIMYNGSATDKSVTHSVAEWFFLASNRFVTGISNSYNMNPYENFLFFRLGPLLSVHGLTEDQKNTGVRYRTLKTTKKGNAFLVYLKKKIANVEAEQQKQEGATPRLGQQTAAVPSVAENVGPAVTEKTAIAEKRSDATLPKKTVRKSRSKRTLDDAG